jgi:[ribosomal protein S5]-alanine N-acetyltransferase
MPLLLPLPVPGAVVRSFEASDVTAIACYANNRQIWLNLRDRFPHPYHRADAQAFIRFARREHPESNFAIALDGEAIGGIGIAARADVERVSAEVGYWLGEPFWGRGLATAAVRAVTQHAIETRQLTRVFALPFAHNTASCRVLEKAGYILEARLVRSAVKDGVVVDQMQYAYIP